MGQNWHSFPVTTSEVFVSINNMLLLAKLWHLSANSPAPKLLPLKVCANCNPKPNPNSNPNRNPIHNPDPKPSS